MKVGDIISLKDAKQSYFKIEVVDWFLDFLRETDSCEIVDIKDGYIKFKVFGRETHTYTRVTDLRLQNYNHGEVEKYCGELRLREGNAILMSYDVGL